MEIKGKIDSYLVQKQVGYSKRYKLYICISCSSKEEYLLQISTTEEYNEDLDRSAYILKELKRLSDETEAEYAKVKTDPKSVLNYDFGFPRLVESFISQEQGDRRINILAFRAIKSIKKLVPVFNITKDDKMRVDLRTSAWMMGKLLKILLFIHNEGISVGRPEGGNILIVPEEHFILFFDWSLAFIYPEKDIPKDIKIKEISSSASAIVEVIGGNLETKSFPQDYDEGGEVYLDFILKLASGGSADAGKSHKEFYELVDSIWEKGFYPFTIKPKI